LHSPKPEQKIPVDAVVLFHPREQASIFLRALLAGHHTPAGAAPVDVLPKELDELRLRLELRVYTCIGRHCAHHAVIGLLRDAALDRARAEAGHPALENRAVRT